MCTHLYREQVESQMEIVICDNEDCDYRFHPQCLKCSFQKCKVHFIDCRTGEKISGLLNQLQQKYEQMEKLLFSLNQTINKRLTMILSQSRQVINKIEQFSDNCLFQDVIPIHFNIDYIMDMLREINTKIMKKFSTIEVYFHELAQPLNLHNQQQSKIHQKQSILFEKENHLDQALDAINSSLKMNSQSLFSMYQKGWNLLLKQKQFEKSLDYLFKCFLLSKKSKKKELKFQIFYTLQESCLFKMKKYNDVIDLSNQYQKEFDENNVLMFKSFALFNTKQYELALISLNQINIKEINNQQSQIFKDLGEIAQKNMQDQKKKSTPDQMQEILKSSLSNYSQANQNKNSQIKNSKSNQDGPIITMFKQTLQKLATKVYQNDDEKVAFLQQHQIFRLEIMDNYIKLIYIQDTNQ